MNTIVMGTVSMPGAWVKREGIRTGLRGGVMVVLTWLRTCLGALPIILTTATAFFASLTALGVYEGEKNRQQFERMKHAYEVYRDYGNYLDSKPSALPCMDVLAQLQTSDLIGLMRFVETAKFQYEPARHGNLAACLDDQRKSKPMTPELWSVDDTRYVRFKMLSHIGALDAALLSYSNNIGDGGIICDNFKGYFLVGTIAEFYRKAIAAGVVYADNYPNVKGFADHIMKGKPCPKPHVLDYKHNELWDRYKAILVRILN